MSVPLAYLGVVIVWSTTPLAIKWSGEDVGFLFGVASRMAIALAVSLLLIALWRKALPRTKEALHVYLAVGVPLFLAMSSVYWGAQYIPSGLISVIFGLTPLITGLMAIYWIKEHSFTPFRVLGLAMSLYGLALIFKHSLVLGEGAHFGILGVFGAVFFHSLGTVWMKKVGNNLNAFSANTGGLIVAVTLYSITWLLFDGGLPVEISDRSVLSIVYLAVFGSVFGAVLFYFALKRVSTDKMALLTLITPVTALLIGRFYNNEILDHATLMGVVFVLCGLLTYQWASFVLSYVLKMRINGIG